MDGGNVFPGSTSAWQIDLLDEQFASFFDFSANSWVEYGVYGTAVGFEIITQYTNTNTVLVGPLNYGDTGSDTYGGTASSIGFPVTITGTTDYVIDGYGTIVLPYITLDNVLRIAVTEEETQDLGFGLTSNSVETEYIYFSQLSSTRSILCGG